MYLLRMVTSALKKTNKKTHKNEKKKENLKLRPFDNAGCECVRIFSNNILLEFGGGWSGSAKVSKVNKINVYW